MNNLRAKFEQILARQGGLFDFEDVVGMIEEGRFQSFSRGDSWIVTQITNYPRKKVLELVFAMGSLEDMYAMQPEFVAFAKENSCEAIIMLHSRDGWDAVKTPGWEKISSNYMRAL